MLDILVQSRRNKAAAKKFFRKLLKGCQYVPRVLITDKLGSYAAAQKDVLPSVEHRQHKRLNNPECVKTLWTDSGTLFWCIRCVHSAGRLLPRLAGHAPGVKGPLRRLRPLTPGPLSAGGLVSPAWPQQHWGEAS